MSGSVASESHQQNLNWPAAQRNSSISSPRLSRSILNASLQRRAGAGMRAPLLSVAQRGTWPIASAVPAAGARDHATRRRRGCHWRCGIHPASRAIRGAAAPRRVRTGSRSALSQVIAGCGRRDNLGTSFHPITVGLSGVDVMPGLGALTGRAINQSASSRNAGCRVVLLKHF